MRINRIIYATERVSSATHSATTFVLGPALGGGGHTGGTDTVGLKVKAAGTDTQNKMERCLHVIKVGRLGQQQLILLQQRRGAELLLRCLWPCGYCCCWWCQSLEEGVQDNWEKKQALINGRIRNIIEVRTSGLAATGPCRRDCEGNRPLVCPCRGA